MLKTAKFSGVACAIAVLALYACVASAQTIPRPLPTFYFPQLGNAVTFHQAAADCKLSNGYKIAGIEGTSKSFLHNTADLVKATKEDAVWLGGYLNFSSPNRSLIHWHDGTKTVANRGPHGVWCYDDILEKIEEVYKRKPKSIIPIIRTKANSKCLSLYSAEVDLSKTLYPSICVFNEAKAFIKNANGGVIVPGDLKNPRAFNLTAMAFNDLHRKLNCLIMPKEGYCNDAKGEDGTTYKNIFVIRNYRPILPEFYVGFLETTDFKTVEAVCDVMYSGFSNLTKGHLMDINLLNSSYRYEKNLATIECFNRTNDEVATVDFRTKKLGYHGSRGYVPIPTNLYFNFTNGKYPEYVKLWSRTKEGKVQLVNDYSLGTRAKPLNLDWCYSPPILSMLLAAYNSFERVKPYMNNREHILRVGLGGYGGIRATPCLKLSYDDLYWPGSQAWLTTCQLPPYCIGSKACKITN